MGRGKLKSRYLGSAGDLTEPPPTYRGKRGRGGYKGTRGRPGSMSNVHIRGGKTYPVLAALSAAQAATSNDQDQESSSTEDGRHRDENDYIRTVVVTAEKQSYFKQVSICLICGSIGKDVEGTMVSCVTCGQSYHTFCVGLHDKLNGTILKRGWRCLDCTVCEGCGEGRDESKLLLCDECDVSCHIYCLDPKLDEIPKGPWRCKWCSTCRRCGQQIPNGIDVSHMSGLCETCFSLRKCPKCNRNYEIADHIIKCQHCNRWLHGKCEDLYGEDMLEAASENGFRCSLCRPQGNALFNDASNLICDYVSMTKCAAEVLHTRNVPIVRPHSVSGELLVDHFMSRAHSFDDGYEDDDVENSQFTVTSGRGRGGRGGGPGRRTLRLGIGGFVVKQPRHRILAAEEDDGKFEEESGIGQKPKLKRPRKPRRSQLEDNYPPSIQEAFFGLKPIEGRNLLEMTVKEPIMHNECTKASVSSEACRELHELSESGTEALREGENFLGDLMDTDLLGMSEDLDIENLEMITDLLNDDDEEDDGLDVNIDDSSVNTGWSIQSGQSPFLSGSQQDLKVGGSERFGNPQSGYQKNSGVSQQSSYPLHTNVSQSGSRSNSQMDDCVERVNQATERWEEDEPLGDRATKAAVLYANINYPRLKEDYPLWNDRGKQIHRIWRSLEPGTRQEYVNKARENRASRAKPKKRVAPNTQRSGITGDSNLSTSRVSSYYYSGQDGENAAGSQSVSSDPSTANPQSSVVHLTKEVFDNYNQLQRRSNELSKYQQAIETDLQRMRKQKKSLIAKRRQMNKSRQNIGARGERVEVDLNEADKQSLQTLANTILVRQKDLENCKRDIKLHASNVRDFELQNNIPHDMYMQNEQQPLSQHSSEMQVNISRTSLSTQSAHINASVNQDGLQPPPPYHSAQSVGTTCFLKPGLQYQNVSGQPLQQQQKQQQYTNVKIENGDWQSRIKSGSKKRKREDEVTEVMKTRILGSVSETSLTSSEEKEIFDILYSVIAQVVANIEADNSLGDLGVKSLDAPKPKKKRTQLKKMSVAANNEYELLLARINAQLGLCSPLPRNALEPLPRNDRFSFNTIGVTDLPYRKDKMPIIGNRIGEMKLIFMDDYYTSIFECPFKKEDVYVLMSDFCRDVNTKALLTCDPQELAWCDEYDVDTYGSRMDSLLLPRRSRSPRLRGFERNSDAKLQVDNEECSVNLIIEGVDSKVCFNNLMALLNIKDKPDFQLDTPPHTPELAQSVTNEVVKVEPEENLTCRHCGALTKEAAVRKTSQQLGITSDRCDEELAFCSLICYFNFAANSRLALSTDDLTKAERFVDGETLAKLRQLSAEHFAKYLHLKVRPEIVGNSHISNEIIGGLLDSRFGTTEAERTQLEAVHVRDLASLNETTSQKSTEKKWKGVFWMQCDVSLVESFDKLTNEVLQKQLTAQLRLMDRPSNIVYPDDTRKCEFCSGFGDGEVDTCGRLINVDANVWVHVNCALWSQEVYECSSGALRNVEEALRRASVVNCMHCGKIGASVRCYKLNCNSHFHLPCAMKTKGRFMKDKTFFCGNHEDVRAEMVLDRLRVFRRLYVEREENQLIAKLFQHNDSEKLVLRVGSLLFHNLGQLLPDQLKKFHNADFIFPVGYTVTRFFWSTTNPCKKVPYKCSIEEDKSSNAVFVVSHDSGGKNSICKYEGPDASSAWRSILKAANSTREKAGSMLRLFPFHTSGETLFGLNESSISKMIESLPGVDQLATYTFKHGGSPLMDLPLAVNPSGCARCEPRFRTLIKNKNKPLHKSPTATFRRLKTDTETTRESRTRGGRGNSLESGNQLSWFTGIATDYSASPYSRFEPGQLQNSTIYSQYQKMKKEWKNNVYLARSRIQGLGLYASKNIEMNSMIIEYKGELIRSEVSEMREKKYEAQNRGVYMFRIDEERVIDATMAGGPARYINHSCDPNCSTRLVTSGTTADDKKIIIIANRPISAGEE
uniref:Histone-lysine N-methyltransferase n=1 Tax=Syphacia muris TaxID=451379 RepID=A0A0N5AVU6_9BILA